MDLSKLSSDLPTTKSLEKLSVLDINRELTDEFRNAAKSVASLYNATGNDPKAKEFAHAAKDVASLYRLASSSTVLCMHKGYLECLDDLLQVISNGDDIENWVLTKRAELTNIKKDKEKEEAEQEEFRLPTEYEFSLPQELNANMHFRPSLSPFSVTYKRPKWRPDRPRRFIASESGSSDDSDEDGVERKRRALQNHDVKRRRREPPSDHD